MPRSSAIIWPEVRIASLEHGLAAIAETRRLHGSDLQPAAQLVDDQRGESLALDVLGDDHERLAALDDRFVSAAWLCRLG